MGCDSLVLLVSIVSVKMSISTHFNYIFLLLWIPNMTAMKRVSVNPWTPKGSSEYRS
jgi:hypothetical protein